jgi:hypothetical protein
LETLRIQKSEEKEEEKSANVLLGNCDDSERVWAREFWNDALPLVVYDVMNHANKLELVGFIPSLPSR